MKKFEVIDLGLMPYQDAYQRQTQAVQDRIANRSNADLLFLVEHPAVYTYGRKSKEGIPPHLQALSCFVERGGEATFHNPGQLVAYPIFKLEEEQRDIHAFLRMLETVIIKTLGEFAIPTEARAGATGVWVRGKQKKIASIGIAFKNWISYHGLAINVSNDLSGFSKINPCGFEASVMTSMEKETNTIVQMPLVKLALIQSLKTL